MEMKLLLLAQQYGAATSGLGTYARALAGGLAAAGHTVTLAVPASQAVRTDGIRIVPMDFAPANLTPLRTPRMAREIRRVLRAEAAAHDLVHFLDAREAVLAGDLPIPAVGSIHDSYSLDWRGRGSVGAGIGARIAYGLWFARLRRLERHAYHRLPLLIANSRHVLATVRDGYGIAPERLRVIPLGLPPAEPVAPEPLAGRPSVLFVGGNFLRKGLPVLLEAAAALRTRLPGLRLHVVGGDRRRPRFEHLARALGVTDRVVFHGWAVNDRVRAMMAGADVFALPSAVEAFGLVYLEAMRAGTAVIATRYGGAAEVFKDGREVLLVDPAWPEESAAAIARLAGDDAFRRALAEAGRAAAGRFTAEAMVEETARAYRDLSAARQGPEPVA
jgi:glycosyltransferase involved in cell wall biosynthesis